MTNADKIIALLSKTPDMDDDEISSSTNIRPRQQVNQICRKLESQGHIRRAIGPKGKVTNSLIEPSTENELKSPTNVIDGGSNSKTGAKKQQATLYSVPLVQINFKLVNELNKSKTLILIPCSGTKSTNLVSKFRNPTIAASLPADIRKELLTARFELANLAHLDEGDLCPAWKRYTGTLYVNAAPALASAIKQGSNIAIISGGYGLLLAEELIGTYNLPFKTSNWPRGLLERVLASYMRSRGLENIVAFVSASTGYREFLERVDWASHSLKSVLFVMPESVKGAMVKAPRAQGEALKAYLTGSLDSKWESSDGLKVIVETKLAIK